MSEKAVSKKQQQYFGIVRGMQKGDIPKKGNAGKTADDLDKKEVKKFAEKPKSEKWINGGFFIFEPKIFDYLNEDCVLEQEPLENLARQGELMAFEHTGFWQPMDTYRETQELNQLWENGLAPWKNW
jgi:glucose-1-phosphate cytidylyltransferase